MAVGLTGPARATTHDSPRLRVVQTTSRHCNDPEFKQAVEAVSVAPCARRPEILAPAGNEAMMRAAVENGADAIYFGVEEFNARLRADNFRAADLPRVMEWLHERGVRGYVTLNTLVFCGELDAAAALLAACSDAGVDAVLVQDLGVAALAARLAPDLPIHASTQMTLTSAEGIAMAQELGMRIRAGSSRREIEREGTAPAAPQRAVRGGGVHPRRAVRGIQRPVPDERGAGGPQRQPRRVCAGVPAAVRSHCGRGLSRHGDEKYVLSPKDLAAYGDVAKLTVSGIAAFKIEGRLKSPDVCRCDRRRLTAGRWTRHGSGLLRAPRRRTLRWMSRRASRWR